MHLKTVVSSIQHSRPGFAMLLSNIEYELVVSMREQLRELCGVHFAAGWLRLAQVHTPMQVVRKSYSLY
jgi:hypothetical protein